jgi:hypothetical protein
MGSKPTDADRGHPQHLSEDGRGRVQRRRNPWGLELMPRQAGYTEAALLGADKLTEAGRARARDLR